jgi:hypothetical protein
MLEEVGSKPSEPSAAKGIMTGLAIAAGFWTVVAVAVRAAIN